MPPLKAVITVIIVPRGGGGDGGTTIMSVAAVSLLQCYKNLTQNQPACGSIPPLSHSGSFHTLRAGSPGGPSHASLLVDLHKTPTMITFLLLSLSLWFFCTAGGYVRRARECPGCVLFSVYLLSQGTLSLSHALSLSTVHICQHISVRYCLLNEMLCVRG